MRVNRRFLYAGVFLLALGAVLVAADLGTIDVTVVRDGLRLWPLVLVLIGVAIVVRRSPAALPAGLLAAGVPGLVLGGAIAVGPRFIADCGAPVDAGPTPVARDGTFDAPATVSITGACGTIHVTTAPGSGWQLTAANSAGRSPEIVSSPDQLSISRTGNADWPFLDQGRDGWTLTLPTSPLHELSATISATDTRIDLAGADLDILDLTSNVSQARVDLSGATVRGLDAVVNLGALGITLPDGADLSGDLRLNGGDVRICVPAGVGLRVTGRGFAARTTVNGIEQSGTGYESAGYIDAAHHAELSVNASFGSIEIDPIGGCK